MRMSGDGHHGIASKTLINADYNLSIGGGGNSGTNHQ